MKGLFAVALAAIALSGCMSNSTLSTVGADTYKCSDHGGFFDIVGTGAIASENRCATQAEQQCAQVGEQLHLLSVDSANATTGSLASSEITFRCVNEDRLASEQADQARALVNVDNTTCASYGFKLGTEGYATCLMQQAQNRLSAGRDEQQNAQAVRAQRAAAEQSAAAASLNAAAAVGSSIQNSMPKNVAPRAITCQTYGSTTTCN